MTQLVIGAALGCIVGECVLRTLRHAVRFVPREQVGMWIRRLPSLKGRVRFDQVRFDHLVTYAGVLVAVAGVIALAVWEARDYRAASDLDSVASASAAGPLAPSLSSPHDVVDADAASAHAQAEPAPAPVADLDPYADSDFKVQRKTRHPGGRLSLKEVLLQRSEAKAGADLLRETHDHARRSQYDCEAAERAGRYLKAGLDVWGFAAWQVKYFPTDGYKGATLAQCKAIKNRVDTTDLNLQAAVAAENHAGARSPEL